jgi:hypothetical protein
MDPIVASLLAAEHRAQLLREAATFRGAEHARASRRPNRRRLRLRRSLQAYSLAS